MTGDVSMTQDPRIVGFCGRCTCVVVYLPDVGRYQCICNAPRRSWLGYWEKYPNGVKPTEGR